MIIDINETVLAIDPSINSSGVALFKKHKLIAADTIKADHKYTDIAERCFYMGALIIDWAITTNHAVVTCMAVEWPQIHVHGSNDRNDLLGLAGVNMSAIAGVAMLMANAPTVPFKVCSYLPSEWACQTKKTKAKPMLSPRALYIQRRLGISEQLVWKHLSHDAIDAIGIGLHHLGRMKPKRVFPGAS